MAGSGGSSIAGADTRPWRERLAASLLYKVAAGAVLALLVMVVLPLAEIVWRRAFGRASPDSRGMAAVAGRAASCAHPDEVASARSGERGNGAASPAGGRPRGFVAYRSIQRSPKTSRAATSLWTSQRHLRLSTVGGPPRARTIR